MVSSRKKGETFYLGCWNSSSHTFCRAASSPALVDVSFSVPSEAMVSPLPLLCVSCGAFLSFARFTAYGFVSVYLVWLSSWTSPLPRWPPWLFFAILNFLRFWSESQNAYQSLCTNPNTTNPILRFKIERDDEKRQKDNTFRRVRSGIRYRRTRHFAAPGGKRRSHQEVVFDKMLRDSFCERLR